MYRLAALILLMAAAYIGCAPFKLTHEQESRLLAPLLLTRAASDFYCAAGRWPTSFEELSRSSTPDFHSALDALEPHVRDEYEQSIFMISDSGDLVVHRPQPVCSSAKPPSTWEIVRPTCPDAAREDRAI